MVLLLDIGMGYQESSRSDEIKYQYNSNFFNSRSLYRFIYDHQAEPN